MVTNPSTRDWTVTASTSATLNEMCGNRTVCGIGAAKEHVARLEALKALGVDQFAIYLQHDAQDETLRAYGQKVLPALAQKVRAKSS